MWHRHVQNSWQISLPSFFSFMIKLTVAELVLDNKQINGVLFVSEKEIRWKSNEKDKFDQEIKIEKQKIKETKKEKNKTTIITDKKYKFILSEQII